MANCFRSKQAGGYELWIDKITLNCIILLNLDKSPSDQKSDEPELKNTMANSICTGHTVDVTAVWYMLH